MHEDELGACVARALEQLAVRRDAARDPSDLPRPEHLRPVRLRVPKAADLEQRVGVGEDLVAVGAHAPRF